MNDFHIPACVTSSHPFDWTTTIPSTEKVQLKRLPVRPREAHTISTQSNAPITLAPTPYDTTI